MDLSIDSLKKAGAFTGAPVKREVKWEQGGEEHTATVYVRPLSYSTAVANFSKDATAARIAASIVNDKGEPVFTPGDITGEADHERGPLCESLTMELLRVIGEVSGFGKKTKTSPSKKRSGTS